MATLSAQEVRECALKLQDDFLRAHAGNPDMDQRDLNNVRNTISYVEKFIRHNRGSHQKAFQHMVEALTWRKSFGVNDIKYEDIDENLWKSGMALNHGFDATGQNVVILCIAKHRKDSKKAEMLRKWIAFCYETHQRVYPNNKMCMVFDMSGAGLSNMDMDLIRFVVNCFKIYFPDLLQWLLVFNMPWILQAAWKIVQSWLSDGAAAKVKFVTGDTIQEYIPAHNLLVRFGGTDPWEYDYEVEKDEMLRLIREVHGETQSGAASEDDTRDSPEEEMGLEGPGSNGASYYNGTNDAEGVEGSLKHVRFSSSIPPSRQSRYGTDEEEIIINGGPDQAVLKKGSATTTGFRRRQVTRLMSLQEDPREKSPVLDRERNGSLPVNFLERPAATGGSVVTVGDVTVSPSSELVFSGQKDIDVYCTLTLKNVSENSVAYKIKTTAPNRYKVRPNLALINPRSVAKVQVMLIQGSEIMAAQDKFLVQTHTFTNQKSIPSSTELARYWRALPAPAVREHRMRCRWQADIPSRAGIKDSPRGKVAGAGNGSVGAKALSPSRQQGAGPSAPQGGDDLNRTVRQLVQTNEKLFSTVVHLQRLNYSIIAILLLLVLTVILF